GPARGAGGGGALAAARKTRLSTARHTPWEIVHAGLGLGMGAELRDPATGQDLRILDYFRRGGPYLSDSIYEARGDDLQMCKSKFPSELERHPNQFLAYFAQENVPLDTRLTVGDRELPLAAMVAAAKKNFHPADEVTFTLIALAVYSDSAEEQWQNRFGQRYSVTDLVALELKADPKRLACGGAHSLFGL